MARRLRPSRFSRPPRTMLTPRRPRVSSPSAMVIRKLLRSTSPSPALLRLRPPRAPSTSSTASTTRPPLSSQALPAASTTPLLPTSLSASSTRPLPLSAMAATRSAAALPSALTSVLSSLPARARKAKSRPTSRRPMRTLSSRSAPRPTSSSPTTTSSLRPVGFDKAAALS